MALKVQDLKKEIRERRLLLLRNFDLNFEEFRSFTNQFSSEFLVHINLQNRPAHQDDATVTGVQTGPQRVHLHGEMWYAPIHPDIVFFYCL